MKYLITLTISLIVLYAFIKRSYKYASVQDSIDVESYSSDMSAPIDYESDKYKEAEVWFSGVGRH
ncbi:hypothetical protein [Mammaliicoccus sciuri]|uniref:hypothetical protein n=1 Tax=Mammaliicoccus sciuri TaxID=1296 RepID=UPI002B256921|nr:hypothetical protein [Mammaliicoccus sciuri]WQK70389.1 hypothetical protein P3T85_09020 [Mammaliicoccus sciuri]